MIENIKQSQRRTSTGKPIKNNTVIAGIILLVIMIIFSACTDTNSESTSTSGIIPLQTYEYSANDTDDQWSKSQLTATVVLDDDNTKITGEGATFKGGILTISSGGTYHLSGSLSDGQILVSASDSDNVQIILSGVSVENNDGATFYEKSAKNVTITLVKNSTNSFVDGSTYEKAGDNDPNSTIYATHDLSINGSGKLTVTGNYNNGISSQDNLVIVDSNITVTANTNALKGRDVLAIKNATLNVTSKKDGLKSNNDTSNSKGFVQIDGGEITVEANNDGIQAQTNLIINDGTINIKTTGTNTDGSESMKALKAVSQVAIKGGSINIDSTDDAIHSNGNVSIKDGELIIKTDDDGVHADYATIIDGGSINIKECFEGLEGATVNVNGGDISIVSSDDGINAAGGSDDDNSTDEFAANENNHIKITNGKVNIVSQGDGLDSNGDMYIEGGKVTVSGPASGAEGAVDTNGEIYFNGGEITTSGNSSMAQSPSDSSTQTSLIMQSSTNLAKGTTIYVTDSSGNIILEHTPTNDYQIIMFSSPSLKEGETYSVCSGSANNPIFKVTLGGINTIVDETGQITELKSNEGGGGQGGAPHENMEKPPQ